MNDRSGKTSLYSSWYPFRRDDVGKVVMVDGQARRLIRVESSSYAVLSDPLGPWTRFWSGLLSLVVRHRALLALVLLMVVAGMLTWLVSAVVSEVVTPALGIALVVAVWPHRRRWR